jgi:hypothetical protein
VHSATSAFDGLRNFFSPRQIKIGRSPTLTLNPPRSEGASVSMST